ncbi:MFS transporter [Novosphingobium sp. P6W]|uniref:MFS transporter n=1 Tax=Novosphingobium sp. P6W TaxID=1609758 RepID=UPI0006962175|nr:MFS transporter [Novosphingobium sp. P6W]
MADTQSTGNAVSPATGRGAAWYGTIAVSLAFTLSYIDRQILSLLVTSIKASLGLSDTQIGILQGVSFSIFHVLATLPLAWLADRVHRPRLMAACMIAWSFATCAAGLAFSFGSLMLARIGVAVSEAGLPPAAQSLLADLHDRPGLARATSIFMLAPFVGGGLALTLGGKLYAASASWDLSGMAAFAALERWQLILLLAGLPGLVLAPAMAFTVREPRMGMAAARPHAAKGALAAFLVENRAFCFPFMIAIALLITILNAFVAWMPTALMRRHGLDEAAVGQGFGIVFILAGASGTLTAGWLVSRLRKEQMLERTVRLMRGAAIIMFLPATFAPLAANLGQALALLAPAIFVLSAIISMSSIPFQFIAPPQLRAQALAALSIAAAFVGTGLGPLLIGLLSDGFEASAAIDPLACALAIAAGVILPIIAICLSIAARSVADLP